ncbi:uncharacterized protein K460DRAFT_118763 [Cucurbitaria berberidis CBS 394.84]|uniref:Uncharacterized protein n=1 Tax=Cucurbitaria berberidis CBS 394.84 TaxID=1168544 RepID=A0A9P4GH38_9PLEO|nr:uncharacterized protein K460DRAFT_118763 [Cucurbitaria berberidis CBS 394.84]KAF1846013.1 hypothetical protein K460DRAFT_118763 [Cucurbitaria berberidis CBS 394.84]
MGAIPTLRRLRNRICPAIQVPPLRCKPSPLLQGRKKLGLIYSKPRLFLVLEQTLGLLHSVSMYSRVTTWQPPTTLSIITYYMTVVNRVLNVARPMNRRPNAEHELYAL